MVRGRDACWEHCVLVDATRQKQLMMFKAKQDRADKKIAEFFYHNAIPFSVAKSLYYQEMVDAILECEAGGGEFIRPRITKFVAIFLSLRALVIQEDNLKHMFSHVEWLSSIYSRHPDGQAIKLGIASKDSEIRT
ncbi:hypothetical protein HAX54_001704 [Datura stramonium]|uniref:Uncharacterized protein n=1 Tax=Datura stramonium TaxID=4076 RepID=A0ABS8WUW1_DATST|nr:hypothetical protein [Datura stramonium]